MKKLTSIIALSLLPVTLSAQSFTLSGRFPGLTEGAKVVVKAKSDVMTQTVAKGIVKNGAFKVSGKLDKPTVCTLAIDDRVPKNQEDYPQDRGVSFMADNVAMTVSAPHFDSIPRNYEMGGVPMLHEKNVTVTGGKFQDEYNKWRKAVYDSNLAYALAGQKLWKYKFGSDNPGKANYDTSREKELEDNERKALETFDKANDAFIAAHPTYAISLYLQSKKLDNAFRYTDEELDSLLSIFKSNGDKAGYSDFEEKVKAYRPYTKGLDYKDIDLQTTDGKAARLKDYIVAGKYNIIDFWASWCGPCRLAIPHVKRLHEEHPEVNIISISCDRNLTDWAQAMDEEKMPWAQAVLSPDKVKNKAATAAYRIQFLPYLIIINPQGKIIYATSSADEVISKIAATL